MKIKFTLLMLILGGCITNNYAINGLVQPLPHRSVETNYTGHYLNLEVFRDSGYKREIFLVHLLNDEYEFIVHTTGSGKCKGVISGTIKIKDGEGYYSTDKCAMLHMSIKDGTINLTTRGCTSMHGLVCQFSGVYEKSILVEFDDE